MARVLHRLHDGCYKRQLNPGMYKMAPSHHEAAKEVWQVKGEPVAVMRIFNEAHPADEIWEGPGCSLREQDLIGASLGGAQLQDIDCSNADLSNANLFRANLRQAVLRHASLVAADLSGANLEGANLEGANLNGANLRLARLNGSNLENANLSWAHLAGADLTNSRLRGAKFRGAVVDRTTRWPLGIDPAALGVWVIDD